MLFADAAASARSSTAGREMRTASSTAAARAKNVAVPRAAASGTAVADDCTKPVRPKTPRRETVGAGFARSTARGAVRRDVGVTHISAPSAPGGAQTREPCASTAALPLARGPYRISSTEPPHGEPLPTRKSVGAHDRDATGAKVGARAPAAPANLALDASARDETSAGENSAVNESSAMAARMSAEAQLAALLLSPEMI